MTVKSSGFGRCTSAQRGRCASGAGLRCQELAERPFDPTFPSVSCGYHTLGETPVEEDCGGFKAGSCRRLTERAPAFRPHTWPLSERLALSQSPSQITHAARHSYRTTTSLSIGLLGPSATQRLDDTAGRVNDASHVMKPSKICVPPKWARVRCCLCTS